MTTGRAKTVLVSGDGVSATGVISSVVARPCPSRGERRLRFSGPVEFDPSVKKHVTEVILPIVDVVETGLGLPRIDIDISIANLGAASANDAGMNITGYSADVPILLAMFSAAIGIPVPADLVSTGHVASADGDIAGVRALTVKLAAAIADPVVQRFIYPAAGPDASLTPITLQEIEEAESAIRNSRDRIHSRAISNVVELVEAVFTDESIVLAALRRGFFVADDHHGDESSLVARVVGHLGRDNDVRFWRVLQLHMLAGNNKHLRALLRAWIDFHVDRRDYPTDFGRRLLQLVRSIPPATRRLKMKFPVIPANRCIGLSQFATPTDHDDVRLLFDAAAGKIGRAPDRARWQMETNEAPASLDANAAVDAVLEQIGQDFLTREIGLPIDAARAAYVIDSIIVASGEEFIENVSAFFLHLLRHVRALPPALDPDAVAADALDLVRTSFPDGYESVLLEAREGTHGGMRLVCDTMTEQLKRQEQTKHVRRVLKEALDPLDWEAQVGFMTTLLSRVRAELPPDLQSEPAERFARHYETIASAYVNSFDRFKQRLRAL